MLCYKNNFIFDISTQVYIDSASFIKILNNLEDLKSTVKLTDIFITVKHYMFVPKIFCTSQWECNLACVV